MKALLLAACMGLMISVANAEVPGNPGTQSSYLVFKNPATDRFELCWVDIHQHGNCMEVGEVFEIIREAQNQYEREEREAAL